jgi:hypothetical protein
VAFDGSGAGTVVADDAALVLHHGERGRKVRWGPRKTRMGAASGSPSGRTAAASRGKSGREARALASEANGPILGRTGEVAVCFCAGEKEQGGKGEWDGGRRLLWWLGGAGGEERWQGGPGFGATWRGKWGRERDPKRGGGQLGCPASSLGWRAQAALLPRDRGGRRGASD